LTSAKELSEDGGGRSLYPASVQGRGGAIDPVRRPAEAKSAVLYDHVGSTRIALSGLANTAGADDSATRHVMPELKVSVADQ
jgi:hypothetical protein